MKKTRVTKNRSRVTKTDTKHLFIRTDEGNWSLSGGDSTNWKESLPTTQFLVLGKSGQAYSLKVADTRNELTFMRDDEEALTIGYDKKSKTVLLDINEEAFMFNKENLFRIQQKSAG